MQLGEGVAFGTLVLGFLGFVFKVTADETNKRARIYGRVDEVKKNLEDKMQTKEICNIHTETINSTLQEIKKDVKSLLTKNGINND